MTSEKTSVTDASNVRFLTVTANTGTVFEKPELLTAWVSEFANLLQRHPADFIALHCQEVGGKDYEAYMHILDPFIKDLLCIPEIATHFTHQRFYFDSDYTSQDTFTALGSVYFLRNQLPIEQWNFTTASFRPVVDRQIFTGNLINVPTLRKEKFPREFFPEAKWSRKGFTQTRWCINDFVFDMVNVHLFHDASNLLAAAQSPSVYSEFRKNALQYTLKNLPLDPAEGSVPFAIFGDFNFRLDAHRLLEHIAEKRSGSIDKIKQPNSDEVCKIIIRNSANATELTVEKKEFNLHDDHDTFFTGDTREFHPFDFESSSFSDQLFEYDKTFAPSYPYSEEHNEARLYLRARCPAWCDRILLNHPFKTHVNVEAKPPVYNILGEDVCMGDHKPVYLAFTIDLVQDRAATANLHPCETLIRSPSNQTDTNHAKSPVTVPRTDDPSSPFDLILNDEQLSSVTIQQFNVHDYAIFVQPALVPQWWFIELRQRPVKTSPTAASVSMLWAKVRAVTYMTTLAHRAGSWYSDDRTERSTLEDEDDQASSTSDPDERNAMPSFESFDTHAYRESESAMPLRRSFSSIDYVKHDELYPSVMPRSRSTTLIDSSDHVTDPLPTEVPPPAVPLPSPPSLPPPPPPPQAPTSRVYRFLHCNIL